MSQTIVRIAIAGLQHGTEHLDHYRGRTDVEVAGICDLSEELLHRTGATYGVPTDARFTNYQEMLRRSQPDAVLVMTPVPHHARMTIDALEAGCHVLVAKSLCQTLAEGEAMLTARDKAGKQVEVGFQMHHAPVYQHVQNLLAEGVLGDVRSAWIQFFSPSYQREPGNWQNRMETLGGALLDCSIHSMDVILYLLNRSWRRVLATGRQFLGGPPERDTMDAATVIIELEDGLRVVLDFSDSTAYCFARTGIVGSSGKCEIEHWAPNGAGHVRFHADRLAENPVRVWVPPRDASTGHIGAPELSRHFIEVCKGNARPRSSLESALESLSVQQAIVLSLRRDGWVNRTEITNKKWR